MATDGPRPPLQPGQPAPDFTLPAADHEGTVSLGDLRGRSPVLLALMRGLYCGFCRRHIAHLGVTREKLRDVGVETLVVVASQPERARLYFRYRPARVVLAADPELTTHRAYGLPNPPPTPDLMQAVQTTRINPTGELPESLPIVEAAAALDRLEGFERTGIDQEEYQRQGILLVGQFLVDRDGIVRWMNIEGASEGPAGVGKFPTDEELLAAARAL